MTGKLITGLFAGIATVVVAILTFIFKRKDKKDADKQRSKKKMVASDDGDRDRFIDNGL